MPPDSGHRRQPRLHAANNHADHYTDAFRRRQSSQLIKALEKQITQS
jgi:hypothetical protein